MYSLLPLRIGAVLCLLLTLPGLAAAQDPGAWAAVPPVDFGKIRPEDFADEEVRYVLPLYHFHRVANAVAQTGATRGFIDLPVWRDPKDNQPFNARVLENHVAFAYFYATDRPWNPYHGSTELRRRLEAILERWCTLQNERGLLPEYAADNYALAPTAFGVRAMGRTLELLASAAPIDPAVHQRVIAAQRKAILAMIGNARTVTSLKPTTNHFGAVYPAALSFAALFPHHREEMLKLLTARMREAGQTHFSPAGYMYEQGGPDWAYTFNIHRTSLLLAKKHAHGTEVERLLNADAERLYTWAGYNIVPHPDGSGYFANAAINTRSGETFVKPTANSLAESIEAVRPLALSGDEMTVQASAERARLATNWGEWPALRTPSPYAYTPEPFIDVDPGGFFPTVEQKSQAVARLPCLSPDPQVTLASDPTGPQQFAFVRRPGYYAAFAAGKPATDRQRFGLGLLWRDQFGAIVQGQPGVDARAWGTRSEGAKQVYEAADLPVVFKVDGKKATPAAGLKPLPAGAFSVQYKAGDEGEKTVSFDDDSIRVTVTHPDAIVEEIPLLLNPDETPAIADRSLRIVRGDTVFAIESESDASFQLEPTDQKVGGMKLTMLRLKAMGELKYTMGFQPR